MDFLTVVLAVYAFQGAGLMAYTSFQHYCAQSPTRYFVHDAIMAWTWPVVIFTKGGRVRGGRP